MSGLLSRIKNLERLVGDHWHHHVATFRLDGSLVPLPPGAKYGRNVALLPEVCATSEEWLAAHAPLAGSNQPSQRANFETAIARAKSELLLLRLRDGNRVLAKTER